MIGKPYNQGGVAMCRVWCPSKGGYAKKRLFPQSDDRYKDSSLSKPPLQGAWKVVSKGKLPTPRQMYLRAEELAQELKASHALGEMQEVANAELAKRHRAKSTVNAYATVYRRWVQYHKDKLGSVPVHLVTRQHVEGYLSWRKSGGNLAKKGAQLSDSTLERDLSAISALFQGLVEEGLIDRSPCQHIKIRNRRDRKLHKIKKERQEKVISEEEMTRLLSACDDSPAYLSFFIRFMAESGLRLGEVLKSEKTLPAIGLTHKDVGLLWKDVDLALGVIHVSGKTGSRGVVVTPELRRALEEWREHSSSELVFDIPRWKVRKDYDEALKAADVSHRTIHDLRHTCATRWLDRGYSLKWVSAQLGHTSLETTMIYVHDDIKVRQAEVNYMKREADGRL